MNCFGCNCWLKRLLFILSQSYLNNLVAYRSWRKEKNKQNRNRHCEYSQCIESTKKVWSIKWNLPEWQVVSDTGREPRRRESSKSRSERFFVVSFRLKRYQGELELLLGSVSDTIEHKISAPPDERLRNDFLRFFDFPLWQLLRFVATRLSLGTELRRWFVTNEDVCGRLGSTNVAIMKKTSNKEKDASYKMSWLN